MLHLEGAEPLPAPPAVVADKLSDAAWLAAALPAVRVLEAGPDRAVWRVRPKLGLLAGEVETTAVVAARSAGQAVKYRLTSTGLGTTSTVDVALAFVAADGATMVGWSVNLVAVGGLLKMVPAGAIRATAEQGVGEVWAAVRAKLAAGG